ncbi:CHRD domain-containing protein [Bacillus sp. Marseille-Q3570]|uniref:CHRD domain-containing protein n=1 Tax=Bacillus sp. Marseille-Q3570 TaxID=2963522 RepID=UPI0021B6E99B|nr:CHRD domain-containing protein [Bacillus sp. Marseille-Q3570]
MVNLQKYNVRLNGNNHVPSVDTEAYGMAKLVANGSQTKIKFIFKVDDIRNFVQAHIHFGAIGQNGQATVLLKGDELTSFEEQASTGIQNGLIAGTITDKNIISNDEGVENVSDLILLMDEGLMYINVSTDQHPEGEIRGQIIPVRKRPSF